MKNKFLFLLILIWILISSSGPVSGLEVEYPEVIGEELTTSTSLPGYVKYIFNFSLGLAVLIAFFSTILGGFCYLTSAGSPKKQRGCKDQILAGILGLIILFSSYTILFTINPQLVIFKFAPIQMATSTSPTFSFDEKKFNFQELPLGTIIENKILNKNNCQIMDIKSCAKILNQANCTTTGSTSFTNCQGITCENPGSCELLTEMNDLDNILYVASSAKAFSEYLEELSKELNDLAVELENAVNNCYCFRSKTGQCGFNGSCGGKCNQGSCGCGNDSCPFTDRAKFDITDPNSLVNEIEPQKIALDWYSQVFYAFFISSENIADVDNNFQNNNDISIVDPLIQAEIQVKIAKMTEIQEKNGDFQKIKQNFENQVKKAGTASIIMKTCTLQPNTYNELAAFKDFLQEQEIIVKKPFCDDPNFSLGNTCEKNKVILPFEDSFTFYCQQ
ncbi:hypothetical protein KAS79_02990 [Candidatus Parcubacteria bacterium]|nr:hypothetical protein [Candidatus Parcubacteria bacterium]